MSLREDRPNPQRSSQAILGEVRSSDFEVYAGQAKVRIGAAWVQLDRGSVFLSCFVEAALFGQSKRELLPEASVLRSAFEKTTTRLLRLRPTLTLSEQVAEHAFDTIE